MWRPYEKAWALTVLVASCGGAAEGDPEERAGRSTGGVGTASAGGSESEATQGTVATESTGEETGARTDEETGSAAGGVFSGETGGAEFPGTGAEPTGGVSTGATGGVSTGTTGGVPTGTTGGVSTGTTGGVSTGATGGVSTGATGGVSTTSGGNSGIGDDGGGTGGGGNVACDAIPGACTRTWHSPESGATTTTTYFYNALGQLEREEEDRDGDGVTDYTVRRTYDEQGRLLQNKADSCDAPLDFTCERTVYTYDEQGNVLVENYFTGADSSASGCTYSSYDEDGVLLSREFYGWCKETLPGYSMTYEYDAAGRLVAEHGVNPDGTILHEYDAANQVSASTSLDADGIVTLTVVYTRDAAGQPLIEERQYPDGDDTQLVRTYDASGNQLTRKLVYLEGDSAGSEASCWNATYDDCGNQLTETYSLECTDVVTTEYAWSYACFAE